MHVIVKLHAQAADLAGTREAGIEIPAPATCGDVKRALATRHPDLEGLLASSVLASESEYLRDLLEFSGPDWGQGLQDFQDRLAQLSVSDVMTVQAVTVARNTPIAQVARTLREHGIHRAWVEEDGRLCGVISTFDLLPLVEKTA